MGAIHHRRWTIAFIAMTAALGLSAVAALGQPAPATPAPADPALAARLAAADPAAGATAGAACLGCHTVTEGGAAGTGPNLFGIVGAPIARDPTFAYSPAMAALGTGGGTWTYEFLDQFITSPFLAVLGTRMGFGGIADPAERANVIAWLRTQAAAPVAIPGVVVAADDPTRPVFQGYQADSGQLYYGEECGNCHGPTGGGLDGAGPPLKGPMFQANWSGRSVWDLFNYTRRFMPEDEPGGLEDQMVARILAYVIELNGFTRSDQPFMVDRAHLEPLILNFPAP